MPADHLTTASPAKIAAAVLVVLSGADLESTATETRMSPVELADAVQLFQAAGLTALEQRSEWYQLAIEFAEERTAESAGAMYLGLRLDRLQDQGVVQGWWFLRKPPGWRLRVHTTDRPAVDRALRELVEERVIARWWSTIYEPETFAFGGPDGTDIAHELFCADSHGVLAYARQKAADQGRRELSLLLINALLREAGLDWFERGDVFGRVAAIRPAPPGNQTSAVEKLAPNVRTLLLVPRQADRRLLADTLAFVEPWLAAYETAGQRLGDAAARGRLDRGLRAVLTHVLIFHWNRFGLSATTQGVLAHAAKAAFLPRS
ncbi:thiopeptide-type bacteriocin biosynthesis protein [Nonomuraea sp. NPDC049504]|uniref:thiopeptide-type bacteriocin biosynthesis protein n=1 Tax=Nonomuraea sp. NPDC049504 TaxID=3154729 RepID=UPI00341D9C9F